MTNIASDFPFSYQLRVVSFSGRLEMRWPACPAADWSQKGSTKDITRDKGGAEVMQETDVFLGSKRARAEEPCGFFRWIEMFLSECTGIYDWVGLLIERFPFDGRR